jgi:2,3-bisphosphoglycerate-independent phosphoglycerate mutase
MSRASPPRGGVLLVMLDGVGVPAVESVADPFAHAHAPTLQTLAGGWRIDGFQAAGARMIDATFAHPDLPQSATGATALLTGVDAVAHMGRPYGPWPGPRLRALLEADSLFATFAAAPGGAALANAYPDAYLRALREPTARARRLRPPASIVAAAAAGVPLRGDDAERRGEGVRVACDEAPARAAARLAAISDRHAFTYLDLHLTDAAGHAGALTEAIDAVERLDRFLTALLERLASDVTLLLLADHGNLEDASTRSHTRAPVPLVARGPLAGAFAGVTDPCGVAPRLRAVAA